MAGVALADAVDDNTMIEWDYYVADGYGHRLRVALGTDCKEIGAAAGMGADRCWMCLDGEVDPTPAEARRIMRFLSDRRRGRHKSITASRKPGRMTRADIGETVDQQARRLAGIAERDATDPDPQVQPMGSR